MNKNQAADLQQLKRWPNPSPVGASQNRGGRQKDVVREGGPARKGFSLNPVRQPACAFVGRGPHFPAALIPHFIKARVVNIHFMGILGGVGTL